MTITRDLAKRLFRLIHAGNGPHVQRSSISQNSRQHRSQPTNTADSLEKYESWHETLTSVVNYRKAHYESRGVVADEPALPTARSWPLSGDGVSYEATLVGLLNVAGGKGAELGPLNSPILSKTDCDVLYVDHLDTEGLKEKYPTAKGIVSIDRPMVNDSLADTLRDDAPLDYVVGSHVFEHVPNPIRWLREVAAILKLGGLAALSLPDRRATFDFLREETRASDWVSAYIEDRTSPSPGSVYDHHSLASFVNMDWVTSKSVTPQEIVSGRGATSPQLVTQEYMELTRKAKDGEYLDVHVSVFTPATFLMVMAQLAGDGLIPFRLHQFYPTVIGAPNRRGHSFTAVLEKAPEGLPPSEVRLSYLQPLGE